MKKLFKNLMMLTAVGAIAFLYSCSEDEEPVPVDAPTVTASSDATTYDVGGTATVSLNYTAAGGLGGIQYTVAVGSNAAGSPVNLDISNDAGSTEGQGTFSVAITEEMGGNAVTIEITVADQSTPTEQTATATVTFNVNEPSPNTGGTVDVILGGQLNATTGSFYDVIGDAVYGYVDTRDAQSANVDFCFFYGNTNMYTIAALDDDDAGIAFGAAVGEGALSGEIIATRNPTRFKALEATATDFDNVVTEADLDALYGSDIAADATKVNGLSEGDVFGFQLSSDRSSVVGLIKVTAVGGTQGSDRSITFDVKFNASAIN